MRCWESGRRRHIAYGHSRCGSRVHRIGSVLHAPCAVEAMAVCRGLGLVAGAVVSAGWAIGALRASRALDNRAASSLEFVVCGDPSINDGAYSYTCDAYAGEKRLGQVRCRVIVSLAPVRMYVLSVEFRALRMMRMGAHACFGASFERLKSSGWYRSTRALQARCLGFETSSLPLSRPRPTQRARSSPALSVGARPSCAPSLRANGFR